MFKSSTIAVVANVFKSETKSDVIKLETPATELIGSKPRSAGLGSLQTLPSQMPEEEKEAFDKEGAIAKEFARTWSVILDSRIPGVGPRDVRKHYENLC